MDHSIERRSAVEDRLAAGPNGPTSPKSLSLHPQSLALYKRCCTCKRYSVSLHWLGATSRNGRRARKNKIPAFFTAC